MVQLSQNEKQPSQLNIMIQLHATHVFDLGYDPDLEF